MITILCPTYNESTRITACIESLLLQGLTAETAEVFFIDGMSTDGTRQIIAQYVDKYSYIHLLDNPGHIVPGALNIGIRQAKGDPVFRIDAHATYPETYFKQLTFQSKRLLADNVGGVIITHPAGKNVMARAVALGMSSHFGVGDSFFRTGTPHIRRVDTVPFGCYPKSLFDRIGLFDEDLARNQDDEFNARICKNGGSIYLIPQVKIDYYARESLSKAARMFFQYGLFKPLVNKKLGKISTLRQLIPPLFVAALLTGTFCAVFFPWACVLFGVVAALYLLCALAFALSETRSPAVVAAMPFVFFVFHISYGGGYWCGLYKLLTGASFSVTSTR